MDASTSGSEYAVIRDLLSRAKLTRAQVSDLTKCLRMVQKFAGRPRQSVCKRGHVRTFGTVDDRGSCLPCKRMRSRQNAAARRLEVKAAGPEICACTHPVAQHDDDGCCYHKTAGAFDCDCTSIRRLT